MIYVILLNIIFTYHRASCSRFARSAIEGALPVGRPKLRYKDTSKSVLKCGNALGQ